MATNAKKSPVKNTKKPAAKNTAAVRTKKAVASKSVSTKTAPKSTAKKTAAKKPAVKAPAVTVSTRTGKSSRRSDMTPLERVRSLNVTSFLLYAILGVASLFLIGNRSSELLLSHQARDFFTTSPDVVLGSASEVLFSVQYRYLLATSLFIGALGAILLATKLRRRYEAGVTAGVSGLRWLFVGISFAVLVDLVSFMAGVQDLMTLKTVAGLVILASLLGWLAERENRGAATAKTVAYYGLIFAYIVALLPLIGSLIGTTVYGNERFGWHVYALSVVVAVGFIANIVISRGSIKKKTQLEYAVFEQRYLRVDQVVKFLAVLILLAAIK